nr:hypothetical protein [Rhodococcus qingshengii]
MSAATGKPVPPMLATLGHPPTGERWAFGSKWDGVRATATTGAKPPALWSRNGNNFSASFPEIVDALSAVLDHRETVLDGEIVALGPDGVPSFSRLQRRMHVLKPTAQIRNGALTTYYVFDVLDIDGTSTTDCPTSNAAKHSPTSASNTRASKSHHAGSTSTDRPCSRSPANTTSKASSPKASPRPTNPENGPRAG